MSDIKPCRPGLESRKGFSFSGVTTSFAFYTIEFIGKNQGVFVKQYAPGDNKVQKVIFSFNVKVKVTRSLTLVSLERASLVEYACQI